MSTMEIIKQIRNKIGMTQVEFADAIGTKQNTVSDYENGKAVPSIKTARIILRLAKEKKIKVTLADIFPDEE